MANNSGAHAVLQSEIMSNNPFAQSTKEYIIKQEKQDKCVRKNKQIRQEQVSKLKAVY